MFLAQKQKQGELVHVGVRCPSMSCSAAGPESDFCCTPFSWLSTSVSWWKDGERGDNSIEICRFEKLHGIATWYLVWRETD